MTSYLDAPEAIRRLKLYAEKGGWTQKQLLEMIDGLHWDEPRLSRVFKNPEGANIKASDLATINKFINETGLNSKSFFQVEMLEGIPDYMYFSMLAYFKYNPMTEIETKSISTGLYRLYRPSLKIPDMYTVGLFHVTMNSETGALCVEEAHIHKGDQHKGGKHYAVEGKINEYFHGYMIRKRRRYMCFQRNSVQKSPNMLITVFNDEFFDGDQESMIYALGGVTFGTTGSKIYVSKVYIERCEKETSKETLIKECDYVYAKDLRPSILKNLRMDNGEPYYIF